MVELLLSHGDQQVPQDDPTTCQGNVICYARYDARGNASDCSAVRQPTSRFAHESMWTGLHLLPEVTRAIQSRLSKTEMIRAMSGTLNA